MLRALFTGLNTLYSLPLPIFAIRVSKFKEYIRTRGVGWWITTVLLTFMLVLIAVPSWRKGLYVWMLEQRLDEPRLVQSASYPMLPEEAYGFSFTDLKGQDHFLQEYQGQVIFINFWATWCVHCLTEMYSIEDLYKEYGDRVTFIIYSDEPKDKVKAFARDEGYDLPFCYYLYRIPSVMNAPSLPTTLIISKTGEVRAQVRGAAIWDSENVKKLLDELIAE